MVSLQLSYVTGNETKLLIYRIIFKVTGSSVLFFICWLFIFIRWNYFILHFLDKTKSNILLLLLINCHHKSLWIIIIMLALPGIRLPLSPFIHITVEYFNFFYSFDYWIVSKTNQFKRKKNNPTKLLLNKLYIRQAISLEIVNYKSNVT